MTEIITRRPGTTRWSRRAGYCLCGILLTISPLSIAAELSAATVKEIAEEAYIYAYPMIQNYKTMYSRSVAGREGTPPRPFNIFSHRTKLLGPEYTAIVGPNNDTLYSTAWLDLRREPLVISVPAVPQSRYYSLQFIDAFVYNFAYIGQRATGSEAGQYLIYGPGQAPAKYPEIDRYFSSNSEFVFVIGRTLVNGPQDIPNVLAIQKQYLITPLSEFTHTPSPPPPEALLFPEYIAEKARTGNSIEYFNFLLSRVNIYPGDKKILERFRVIGIQAGGAAENLPADLLPAIDEGVQAALEKIRAETMVIGNQVNGWNTTYKGFGSREDLQGRFLVRAAAAMIALYGNDREENSGFSRTLDASGLPLDAGKKKYSISFAKGQLPPTNAFWSLTMYRYPEIQLVRNPIKRYSVSDRTGELAYAPDGSLTIYLQHTAPAQQSNWLPAPDGPFALSLRIYLPQEGVLNGTWEPPQITEID